MFPGRERANCPVMLRLSLAGLRTHFLRTLLAAAAVALGVMFLAGTLVYADTARAGFYADFARHGLGINVAVNPPFDMDYPSARLSPDDLNAVRQVPGVAVADGRVVTNLAVLDHTGRALTNAGKVGYAVSVPDPTMSPAVIVAGAMPTAPGQAALNKPVAARLEVGVGDTVTVVGRDGKPARLTLTGIVDYGAGPIFNGWSVVVLTAPDLSRLTPAKGYSTIVARAAPGVDPVQLRGAVRQVMGFGDRVVTGADLREQLAHDSAKYVDGFLTVLLAGSLVALVVAALVVYNTFSILAAQRTRELALLRCVGTSRRQLAQIMLTECLVVGAGAATVGAALSLLVAPLIMLARNVFGAEEPSQTIIVAPGSLLTGFVVGVLATLAAGVVPAVRASGISPMAVLRASADDGAPRPGRVLAVRLGGAAGLGLLGLAVMSRGLGRGFDGVVPVIAGGMILFIGVVVALPAVIAPLTRLVGWLPARLFGVSGRLAIGNAQRHPTRAAAAATALMIGVALVSLFTVVLATASDQAERELAENFPIDFELDAVSPFPVGSGPVPGTGPATTGATLPDSLLAALDRRPEFDVVVRSRLDYLNDRGGLPIAISAIDPRSASRTGDDPAAKIPVEVLKGSLDGLGPGTVAVRTSYADSHGVTVGDTVGFAGNGRQYAERIVAIYDDAPVEGQVIMAWNEFNRIFGDHGDQILIRRSAAVDAARAEQALDQVLTAYPLVVTTSTADRRADLTRGITQRLAQFDALLGISLVIAILGIMDTLALSVLERTRESATLRALGLSRGQLRATILVEAIVMSLIGGAIGVAFGILLGRTMALSLVDVYGHGGPTVPVPLLAGYVVLAGAAGALAALVPARRAGRAAVVFALADA